MSNSSETLIQTAYIARKQGKLQDARQLFSEAVARCRRSSEQALLARALTGLGQIERDLKNTTDSLRHYREAANIYRSVPDPLRLAHTVRHLGDILREDGSIEQARPCYEEALRIYGEHDETSPLDLANTIRGFAHLRAEAGEKEQARDLWQQARSLYEAESIQPGVNESDRQIDLLSNP